ncbi:hypothetical protein D3C87_1661600 [compost metagenome]
MKSLQLNKACYFTLYHVEQFYPGIIPEQIRSELSPKDTAYLNEIAVSGEDKIIRRQMTFMDEAFHLTYKK